MAARDRTPQVLQLLIDQLAAATANPADLTADSSPVDASPAGTLLEALRGPVPRGAAARPIPFHLLMALPGDPHAPRSPQDVRAGLDAVREGRLPSVIVLSQVPVRAVDGARWALVQLVAACLNAGVAVQRPALAEAARALGEAFAAQHPGRSIEVRVPPFTAVQIGDGTPAPTHTRGTPPSVVETSAEAFVPLLLGDLSWADAVATGRVSASGSHADLGRLLPLR